jgi:tetratricopeptide (TPR) repeat protein
MSSNGFLKRLEQLEKVIRVRQPWPFQLDISRMSSDLSITSATAYNNRGDAYVGKGDKEKAIADYRKALSINPSYQDAKDGLKKFGVSVP